MFKRILVMFVLTFVLILTACGSIKTIMCEECGTENDIANLYCSNCAMELVLTEDELTKVKVERVDNRCDIILKYIEENKHEEALDLIKKVEESVGTDDKLRECKYQLALVIEDRGDKYRLFSSLGDYKEAEEKAKESYYDWAVYLSGYKIQQPTAYKMFAELGDYKDSKQKAEELLAKMDTKEVYELGVESYMDRDFESAKFFFKKCKNYEATKQHIEYIDILEKAEGVYEYFNEDDKEGYSSRNRYVVIDGRDLIIYDFTRDVDITSYEDVLLTDGGDYGIVFTTREQYPETSTCDVYVSKNGKNLQLREMWIGEFFKYKKTSEYTAAELKERWVESWSKPSDSSSSKPTPRVGMTADEVKASSWGSPIKINKRTYSWGVKEQWVYLGERYIYLEDGKVTAISE